MILPGNPGICGSVPGTLEAAQLTPNGSTVLTATSFGVCPEASNAAAPIPAEAKVNSSDDVLVALVPRYGPLPFRIMSVSVCVIGCVCCGTCYGLCCAGSVASQQPTYNQFTVSVFGLCAAFSQCC